VLENVMLAGKAQVGERLDAVFLRRGRIRRDEGRLRSAAEAVLHKVGLGEKAAMKAVQLSGGQKKLLELARCLMSGPKLILLDEPTAGVNPSLIRELIGVIRMLRAEGTTLLVIEHNMNVVMQLCEQVIVLDRGRVIAEGAPGEIQQNAEVLNAYLGHQSA
jgi:neutral amino acid transport system ATP-binding protein